jgi:hypothetical protein
MKFTAHQFIGARVGIGPGEQAISTVNGAGINVQGVDECLVHLILGTITTSGTVDVKVQHSDDNSTFSDITGAVFNQKTEAGGDSDDHWVGRIDLTGAKKYIRIVSVVAVAVADICVVVDLILGPGTGAGTVNPPTAAQSQKDVPVGQINTVEFNVTPQAA